MITSFFKPKGDAAGVEEPASKKQKAGDSSAAAVKTISKSETPSEPTHGAKGSCHPRARLQL